MMTYLPRVAMNPTLLRSLLLVRCTNSSRCQYGVHLTRGEEDSAAEEHRLAACRVGLLHVERACSER
jgi:hypothetical protein